MVDSEFGKGSFMRMCTVATTPTCAYSVDAVKVAAAVLTASNCRERGLQWKPWNPSGSATGHVHVGLLG